MSAATDYYVVRRWRGFVDPSDLPTAALLLASGARFESRADFMPNSPSATEVYYDAAHCANPWPFARPNTGRMQWFNVNDEHGGVLDVFEFTHIGSTKRGVFVSLTVGCDPAETDVRNSPVLTVSPSNESVSNTAVSLFAPTTDIAKTQCGQETALILLAPIFGSTEKIAPYVGAERAVSWSYIAHNRAITIEPMVTVGERTSLHGFSLDRSVYIDHDDPLWTANPRPAGMDLNFDDQTKHGIFTQFVLDVHGD